MIYSDGKQKIRDMKDALSSQKTCFRMATVSAISTGRPIIRFYGESKDSLKKYKYLAPYIPTLGDTVLLAQTSGTYVILGRVV